MKLNAQILAVDNDPQMLGMMGKIDLPDGCHASLCSVKSTGG